MPSGHRKPPKRHPALVRGASVHGSDRLGFVRILSRATGSGSFGFDALRCVRIRVRLGFVRIPGRSGSGTFDPAWVRSDARELRVRLGRAVPTTPPTGARGVDDRLGNSARRHASARSGPSLFAPTGAGTGTMKGNARAWRLPGRVGRRRAGWGMGPQPLSVRRRGPTPLRPGNPTLDRAGSLLAGGDGQLGKRRGSLRRGPSFYAIVGI